MRKKLLVMMTALAVTAATVPTTAMAAYAESMDIADNTEVLADTQTEDAKKKAEEAKKKAEEEAKKKAEEEAERQAEEARRAAEEEAERQAEEARRAAEEAEERQAEEAAESQDINYDINYVWEENTEDSGYTCTAIASTEEGTVLTEKVEATLEEIPASCEEAGQDIYTAVFENQVFETQVKKVEIPALGHLFGEEPTYTWNDADNTCTATRSCDRDGYTETETVTVSAEVIQEATCVEAGYVRYIAEFTNPAFSAQLKKVEIPATGHRFAEAVYSWNDADNTCTATRVCEIDGYTETETAAATSEVILEPTSTEQGIRRYIVTFTNPAFSAQLKKVAIPATGKKPAENKKEDKKENKTVVKKTTAQNQNTAQATKKASPVKTGDTTQPIIPIAVGTGALAAIAAVILKFRRNRG